MKQQRSQPYIWVSWISKLMGGDNQCQWAAWFRAHYKHDKLPSDFDTAKWTAGHNQLLRTRTKELKDEGFEVYIEDQNSFKIESSRGFTLSGKADIVAIKGDNGFVEDCKTGSQKAADSMQVIIYMLSLPVATTHCKGLTLEGRVVYKDAIVEVPSSKVDDGLKSLFKETVRLVGDPDEPEKIPSWGECRWCDISKADCPMRVDVEPTAAADAHDLF